MDLHHVSSFSCSVNFTSTGILLNLHLRFPDVLKRILNADVTNNYDVVFLCGDLNFRLTRTREQVVESVAKAWNPQLTSPNSHHHHILYLLESDQLKQSLEQSQSTSISFFQQQSNDLMQWFSSLEYVKYRIPVSFSSLKRLLLMMMVTHAKFSNANRSVVESFRRSGDKVHTNLQVHSGILWTGRFGQAARSIVYGSGAVEAAQGRSGPVPSLRLSTTISQLRSLPRLGRFPSAAQTWQRNVNNRSSFPIIS